MSRRRARVIRERAMITSAIIIFIVMFCFCSYVEHTYTREATVWMYEDGTVSFIDGQGYEWAADVDNVTHGQKVVLIMDDNCSSNNIYDDYIKDVKPVKIHVE